MWGSKYNSDFWTALAEGEVDAPECRAVKLLQSISDSYRFSLYCYTGKYPAMGNITKRTYMVRFGGGADELHDGCLVASWCIHSDEPLSYGVGGWHGGRRGIPPTDEVITIKNMIEGSEEKFWKIGNRSKIGEGYVGIVDPSANLEFGKNPFEASLADMTGQDLTEMVLNLPAETAEWVRRRPDEVARAIRASAAGIRREFR